MGQTLVDLSCNHLLTLTVFACVMRVPKGLLKVWLKFSNMFKSEIASSPDLLLYGYSNS